MNMENIYLKKIILYRNGINPRITKYHCMDDNFMTHAINSQYVNGKLTTPTFNGDRKYEKIMK
jgi:hypothetical protein